MNSDIPLLFLAGAFITLFGLFGLFTAPNRSRESEGEYSSSTFMVPSLIQIAIGVFCLYSAFTRA